MKAMDFVSSLRHKVLIFFCSYIFINITQTMVLMGHTIYTNYIFHGNNQKQHRYILAIYRILIVFSETFWTNAQWCLQYGLPSITFDLNLGHELIQI